VRTGVAYATSSRRSIAAALSWASPSRALSTSTTDESVPPLGNDADVGLVVGRRIGREAGGDPGHDHQRGRS